MVPDKITNLDPAGQPQRPEGGPNPVSNDPAFRRMLERLEELQAKSDAGEDATEDETLAFMDALKKADDDFVAAMDLRRKLEEAYRRNQP